MTDDEHLIAAMSQLIEMSKKAPAGKEILVQCIEIAALLLEKNASYGNSALDPIKVFAKVPPGDQLDVRIDDKLNRIKNSQKYPGDNDLLDLVGYLVLKMIHNKTEKINQ